MRFFLASEAKNPATIKKLEEYVGGIKGKSIAYIPTAANAEEGWDSWKKGGTWKLVQSLGAKVTMVQLEDYRNQSAVKEMEDKDIVWFAGGNPGYLAYWMKRCSLDLYLPKILENGALYVGSSAGAMVVGKSLQASAWEFVDGERGAEDIKPLGLVNFDIFPHYEESLLLKIKENYNGDKLYLLKNGEEIIVEDGKINVVGVERIIP